MKCLKVTSLIPTTSGADLHLDKYFKENATEQ